MGWFLALAACLPVASLPVRAQELAQGMEDYDSMAAGLQEDAYILGPGDGLALKFLASEQLSTTFEVLSDGTASLPLIGSARLSGLTVSQANQWLQQLYRQQLLRPDLQLTVTRPRPLRVSLVGEVQKPGLYTLTTSEASQTEVAVAITGLPTLVDAIQKAGGITTTSDLRRVTLQRRLPGTTPRFKRTRVNLLALILEGNQLHNPLLFDGDVIRLERAGENPVEITELASTTLAPRDINVNIIGEVKDPGIKQVPSGTPLMKALLTAGGVEEWRARKSRIELVRINRNGSVTRREYQLDFNQNVDIARNPPLREGDTVLVNRSYYAITSDAVSAVSSPLTGLVNILTLFRLLDDNNN